MYKKAIASIIVLLTLGLLFVSIPQAKANPQFVIASWDYPDEYGQGIEGFEKFENSTGFWVQIGGMYAASDTASIIWNASLFIKLRVYSWINSTFLGLGDTDEGKLYQQHNVTVTNQGNTIFTQQNISWFYDDDSIDPPLWFYGYEVVLNFLPQVGEIYIVTVTYEVYW